MVMLKTMHVIVAVRAYQPQALATKLHIYKHVSRATSTSGSVHCSWGRLIWKVTQDIMLQPQVHRASWKERLLSALYQHNVDTERLHEEAKDHAVCRTYLLKGLHLTYAIHVML